MKANKKRDSRQSRSVVREFHGHTLVSNVNGAHVEVFRGIGEHRAEKSWLVTNSMPRAKDMVRQEIKDRAASIVDMLNSTAKLLHKKWEEDPGTVEDILRNKRSFSLSEDGELRIKLKR